MQHVQPQTMECYIFKQGREVVSLFRTKQSRTCITSQGEL